MDEWKTINGLSKTVAADLGPSTSNSLLQNAYTGTRQKAEMEVKDPIAARKVQKAESEKLRRDRLNEQFLELESTLNPDRPKVDKATILTETIHMLKDLTAEVNRLKAEFAALSEESREIIQEKNELREEKASLNSDIENLNVQCQQRLRIMFPWAGIDPSIVMAPPYSYPLPLPVPSGPIHMHPSLHPSPFYGNQNHGAIPNPCSTFIRYPTSANPTTEQLSTPHTSSSHISSMQDSRSKSLDQRKSNNLQRSGDPNDVATELELKMPGSSVQQDLSKGEKKAKKTQKKERSATNGSSSSRFSSSQGLQDSSSNNVGDVSEFDK